MLHLGDYRIVRVLIGTLGVLSCYAAFFMYEDEEGVWQSRISNLWISASDRSLTTSAKYLAIVTSVALHLNYFLIRVFGSKILSMQMTSASICYSWSLGIFLVFIVSIFFPFGTTSQGWISVIIFGIFMGLLGVLPNFMPLKWARVFYVLPIILVFLVIAIDLIASRDRGRAPVAAAIFASTVWISALVDVCVTIFTRRSLQFIVASRNLIRPILAIVAQLLVATLLVFGPIYLTIYVQDSMKDAEEIVYRPVQFLVILNSFSAILCLGLSILLTCVVIHQILWPLFARLIYPFARYELFKNRKLLSTIGSISLLFAVDPQMSLAKSIFQAVAK